MTVGDDILTALARYPDGLSDAELARRLGKVHQHINQECRRLEAQGLLQRRQGFDTIVNVVAGAAAADVGRPVIPAQVSLPERSWDWEGNVQAALCRWLTADGWSLVQVVDTASRQRGTDVIAERHGERLHLEVKGYPSTAYADPRRALEIKPTQPTLQAKHWFAGVLLSAIQLREQHANDRVAIGLPTVARYRSLVHDTEGALRLMRIEIFMVAEDGSVTEMTRGAGDDAA